MKVSVSDALPGELLAKLPALVQILLAEDGVPADQAEAAARALAGALDGGAGDVCDCGTAGCTGAHDRLHKARDPWPYPVLEVIHRAALDAAHRRRDRLRRRLDLELDQLLAPAPQAIAKAERALTADERARLAALVQQEHAALAVELFGTEAIPVSTVRALVEAGVLTASQVEAAGLGGLVFGGFALGSAAAFDPRLPLAVLTLAALRPLLARFARRRIEVTPDAAPSGEREADPVAPPGPPEPAPTPQPTPPPEGAAPAPPPPAPPPAPGPPPAPAAPAPPPAPAAPSPAAPSPPAAPPVPAPPPAPPAPAPPPAPSPAPAAPAPAPASPAPPPASPAPPPAPARPTDAAPRPAGAQAPTPGEAPGGGGGGPPAGGGPPGGGGGGAGGGDGPTPPPEPSDWEREAARAAQERGGSLISGLGNQVAADMTTTSVSSTNDLAEARRGAVADAIAEGLRAGEAPSKLRQRVADVLNEDYARDLDRIIATELANALNEGLRTSILERFGDAAEVIVQPSPMACRQCRRLYLGPDGEPRRFPVLGLPPNSINFRRRQVQWVAAMPPLHPWCMCTLLLAPPRKQEGTP